jgi:16S rRNA (adenine1518-N6/adenine1519-N6)-dimethyltransferase
MSAAAKRSLGQHFLVSHPVIRRIAEVCRFLSPEAAGVVEVGPGKGALTGRLSALGKPLALVELDGDLAEDLRARFPGAEVHEADARAFDWCSLPRRSGLHPWFLAGNLPYNAGTQILWRTLLRRDTFCGAVVMLQLEVARKFCADAGEEGYGPYAAWADPWWERRIQFAVKPGAFRPQPKVTSAVCSFVPRRAIAAPSALMPAYWNFVSAAFAQPRKTLLSNLTAMGEGRGAWAARLEASSLVPNVRPAQVPPGDLLRLFLPQGR